jgi:hypothetical protein
MITSTYIAKFRTSDFIIRTFNVPVEQYRGRCGLSKDAARGSLANAIATE